MVNFISGYHTARYPSLRQFDAAATTFLTLHSRLRCFGTGDDLEAVEIVMRFRRLAWRVRSY